MPYYKKQRRRVLPYRRPKYLRTNKPLSSKLFYQKRRLTYAKHLRRPHSR